jgi:hypothetical protein
LNPPTIRSKMELFGEQTIKEDRRWNCLIDFLPECWSLSTTVLTE